MFFTKEVVIMESIERRLWMIKSEIAAEKADRLKKKLSNTSDSLIESKIDVLLAESSVYKLKARL